MDFEEEEEKELIPHGSIVRLVWYDEHLGHSRSRFLGDIEEAWKPTGIYTFTLDEIASWNSGEGCDGYDIAYDTKQIPFGTKGLLVVDHYYSNSDLYYAVIYDEKITWVYHAHIILEKTSTLIVQTSE